MRFVWRVGATLAAGVAISACGGGGTYGGGSTSAPLAPTPAVPSGAVTVSIIGSAGTGAYVPNPVQVPAGGQMTWKNNDSTVHHIVLDDGSADLGDLAPGATSRTVTLRNSVVGFHCTIHPTMVGSINGSAPDPGSGSGGGYGY